MFKILGIIASFYNDHKESFKYSIKLCKNWWNFTGNAFYRISIIILLLLIGGLTVIILQNKYNYDYKRIIHNASLNFNDPNRRGIEDSIVDNNVRIELENTVDSARMMGTAVNGELQSQVSQINIEKIIVVKSTHKRNTKLYETSLKIAWSIFDMNIDIDNEKRRDLSNYPKQYWNYNFTSSEITNSCGEVFDWIHKYLPEDDVTGHIPYCEFYDAAHYMRCEVIKILHFLYRPEDYNVTVCVVPETYSRREIVMFIGRKDNYNHLGHAMIKTMIGKLKPKVYQEKKDVKKS